MKIIDAHTHAFPDSLAEKAITALTEHSGKYKPFTDGSINGLIKSMDRSNIDACLIANIATKPEQFAPIMKWSESIHSKRIIPLGSIHPDTSNPEKEILQIKDSGFPGIKLHSMYQNFAIDEKRMYPIYEIISSSGLFILFHAGYDIAFPDDRRSSADKIAKVLRDFPDLKIISAHLGAWQDWENVLDILAGKNIYLDTSFISEVKEKTKIKVLKKHDINKIVFGSDSPWQDHNAEVNNILKLNLSNEDNVKIFSKNIENLLESTGYIFKN
jgi:uncharacterized protein